MKTIPATEAKAKFSAILSDVERGEVVEITRHGKVVARLSPEGDEQATRRMAEAVRRFQKWRSSLPKTGITVDEILQWRDEGRR